MGGEKGGGGGAGGGVPRRPTAGGCEPRPRQGGGPLRGVGMSPRFTRRFRVRHYEVDAAGRVGDVTLVRYMQESAIEASAALGLGPDWYRERGTAWVVRRLAVRCLAPAGYGDEVGVTTWVSGLRGVRCTREYDLTRGRDGARVARARAEWVYVDAATGQPTLTPDEWAGAFPRRGAAEDVGVRLGGARRTEGA